MREPEPCTLTTDEYTIDCTGDVVAGDQIAFDRALFAGGFRNARFVGHERIVATVIRESYGALRQQHTFTLKREDGRLLRIKGRNLYANQVLRKRWLKEDERHLVATEKHQRGDRARRDRQQRKEQQREQSI